MSGNVPEFRFQHEEALVEGLEDVRTLRFKRLSSHETCQSLGHLRLQDGTTYGTVTKNMVGPWWWYSGQRSRLPL